MCELAMTIPDESLAALADSPEKASAELRMLAAVKVFELKKLSSGAAARLAGVSRVEFLRRLGEYGVAVFDMTEKEFEQETRLGPADHGMIPAVGPVLLELDRHDFHMSPRIRETILKAAGETPR